MFCSNCGNQITEDVKFCPVCGTETSPSENKTEVETFSDFSKNEANKPKRKKKIALIVTLSVIGGLLLTLSFFGIVIGIASEYSEHTYIEDQIFEEIDELDDLDDLDNIEDAFVDEPDEQYLKIFTDNDIVENTPVFDTENTAFFAKLNDEGAIETYALGYTDDKIMNMNLTVYVPIDHLTDDDIPLVEQNLRKQFANAEKEDFITITYRTNDAKTFFEIYIEIDEVENRENITKLQDLGYVAPGYIIYVSFEKTKTDLISDGYLEK